MKIQVSYTGRGYQSATLLPSDITLGDDSTVDDALGLLAKELPDDQQLPPSCLLAVSGEHIGTVGDHSNRPLRDGDELILLAPVAGG